MVIYQILRAIILSFSSLSVLQKTAMVDERDGFGREKRWAHFRFSVIGPLLYASELPTWTGDAGIR